MDLPLATWSDENPPIYRYTLRRPRLHGTLEAPLGAGSTCVFLLLNPSTATEVVDDPTIRRCIDFARRWGYDALTILNAYALRSTDPKGLWRVVDPVGPGNDAAIAAELARPEVSRVVCGWGKNARYGRVRHLKALLANARGVSALAVNRDGSPAHPLYLPGMLDPQPFDPMNPAFLAANELGVKTSRRLRTPPEGPMKDPGQTLPYRGSK